MTRIGVAGPESPPAGSFRRDEAMHYLRFAAHLGHTGAGRLTNSTLGLRALNIETWMPQNVRASKSRSVPASKRAALGLESQPSEQLRSFVDLLVSGFQAAADLEPQGLAYVSGAVRL